MSSADDRPGDEDGRQPDSGSCPIDERADRHLSRHHPELERGRDVGVLGRAQPQFLAENGREHRQNLPVDQVDGNG
jgi:hypothetical protein